MIRSENEPAVLRALVIQDHANSPVARKKQEHRLAGEVPETFAPNTPREIHTSTTCTITSIRSKASAGPSHTPLNGEAFSASRATATETWSQPTKLLFVGSNPRQPAPGI